MDMCKIKTIPNNWLVPEKTISDYHHVFKYEDEYGYTRFYTLCTYFTECRQAYSKGPFESLGFWSDRDGAPLCEDGDPFNNGDVNNTGSDINELHYRSYCDLRNECHYFWDVAEEN